MAIARYMQSFEDTDGDGIANVSDYYSTTHGRKVVEDSRNIADLLKHPNKFAGMIVGICAGLLFSDYSDYLADTKVDQKNPC